MTRIPQPGRHSFEDPDELAAYDLTVARSSVMLGSEVDEELGAASAGDLYGPLLQSPPLAAMASRMSTLVREAGNRRGSYSHADREWIDQVLSADWRTNVVQAMHLRDAVAVGVRPEAIQALRAGRDEELTEDERLLTAYIRQVVSGTVDEATFQAMRRRVGVRGVTEYTGTILWVQWVTRGLQAMGADEPSEAELDETLRALAAGEPAATDYRTRMV